MPRRSLTSRQLSYHSMEADSILLPALVLGLSYQLALAASNVFVNLLCCACYSTHASTSRRCTSTSPARVVLMLQQKQLLLVVAVATASSSSSRKRKRKRRRRRRSSRRRRRRRRQRSSSSNFSASPDTFVVRLRVEPERVAKRQRSCRHQQLKEGVEDGYEENQRHHQSHHQLLELLDGELAREGPR